MLEKSLFQFMLNSVLAFQIEGYRNSSGEMYFPKSWKVEEITFDQTPVLLDEQNDNIALCSTFAEATFSVISTQEFMGYRVGQTNGIGEETRHFSLSAIKFFGTMGSFLKFDESELE
jgi:hypothetical protein